MSEATRRVTLQINLTPSDLPHAAHILPHQLRQWAGQVDEILFVVDTVGGRGPRYERWNERIPGLRRLLEESCERYPHARCLDVDYSPAAAQALADALFGGHRVPLRDWNGTAVYPYFFGLYAATNDYVFHVDSDMMFGGGSATWVQEALDILDRRPEVLACNPLPGPPTADGRLRSQDLEPVAGEPMTFTTDGMSTRLFLIDRERLRSAVGPIRLTQPPRHRVWQALAEGRPPYDLAEVMLSREMVEHRLLRLDFLGSAPGMWSIHPPHRSKLFYDSLPELIERVETDDLPDVQRGDHDINEGVIDWSDARRPLSARLLMHAGLVVRNMADLLRRERQTA